MELLTLTLNEERQVTLTAILQGVGGEYHRLTKRRPAVLVIPGGAYDYCSERESEPVALAFAKAGYQAFVLRYSTGAFKGWPNPMEDYEQAMALIRSKADEWNLWPDKLAVIGFSAGGHLAACGATLAEHRPDAAVLIYPVTTRETADMCGPGMPAPAEHVSAKTPPCFLAATRTDMTVPVLDTLRFEEELVKFGIEFESHIYGYGNHGFATGDQYMNDTPVCARTANWIPDCIGWLEDLFGVPTFTGFEEPVCPPKVNGNRDGYLSLDCTGDYLLRQEAAAGILQDVKTSLDQAVAEYAEKGQDIRPLFRLRTLRETLRRTGVSEEELQRLDDLLKKIPNPGKA